ncbi:hypothetical protein DFV88_24745 [Salmonella enterica subsp. enterica serovar Newport]|nr:hypothetical protein [Salmonella enterica subsp. enterica serovar Newport]
MSKIAKFIKSALNNSSANEAAQALKMAAATMQKEGINPADFLQEKGADSDNSAVASLKATVDRLERELEAAKRSTGGANAAELREAKELAIKWHRVAQAQEAHLKELAPVAVAAQEKVTSLTEKNQSLKNMVTGLGVAGVIGCLICFGLGSSNGEDTGRSIQANANWSEMQSKDQQINDLRIQLAQAQSASANKVIDDSASKSVVAPISTGKATCWIQGEFDTKNGKPISPVTLKFWFNNGIVTTFENNRASESEKVSYDRKGFVNQINKTFPGKTDCKLGVNK